MKALQFKPILVLSFGILLGMAFLLENCCGAQVLAAPSGFKQRETGAIEPVAAPAPVAKPIGVDPVALAQSLDSGDIAGGIRLIELGWKQQFENYYQGRLTSRLRNVNQIAKILKKNHRKTGQKAALIYLVPAVNHLDLVLITPEGYPVHRRIFAANREALTATSKVFRNQVTNPTNLGKVYLPSAQALYQWMIAPLEPELKARGINTLIFCLGKGLRSLPLAALHDGQQFLVEKYSLAIIPAFNLLNTRVSRLQNIQVLAMGASEFKDKSSLPGVPLELAAIIDELGKGERWLNQNFTLKTLKERRETYPFEIVHLATHAKFSPGDVSQSYIQFWDDQLKQNQFKSLGLRSPKVQLLVLSACQTALGDAQAELGFAGLAVQSGSKAALASLWAVSDAGTLRLMSEFYRQLPLAPTKAEALRQTQIEMLKGKKTAPVSERSRSDNADYTHPYYWSAFTLVGNPW